MISTFTPRESLAFAAKLRTNYSDDEIDERVENIISRLGLNQCADTLIGDYIIKGISGGERKRTSIGYELITDP
jgi:ABC-type multidrug transport system ATPase subunit